MAKAIEAVGTWDSGHELAAGVEHIPVMVFATSAQANRAVAAEIAAVIQLKYAEESAQSLDWRLDRRRSESTTS